MTPQPSEQPRTAAGQALLEGLVEAWESEYGERPDASQHVREGYAAHILAIEAEAAAPDPVASPPGYWEASGDINPDQAQSMGPVLEEAAANGKQLVVHESITLRWRSAVASPPADGFVVVGTCHTHQVYDCWECRPKRWVASPAPLDEKRLAKLVGQALYGWGDDEPNGATGYLLRAEAETVARHLLREGWQPPPRPAGQPVAERLTYLRGEIEAERISYGEIAELQGLAEHIDPSDVVLLEWAGVPEFPEDESPDAD